MSDPSYRVVFDYDDQGTLLDSWLEDFGVLKPVPIVDPVPPSSATVLYVSPKGRDTNAGTKDEPIATTDEVLRRVHFAMYSGTGREIWVLFERDGVWQGGFGETKTIPEDPTKGGQKRWVRGESPERPFVLSAYGTGDLPTFNLTGSQEFWRMNGGAYVSMYNLRVTGEGASLAIRTAAPIVDLKLYGCRFKGARLELMSGSDPAKRFNGFTFHGGVVQDLILPEGDSSKMSGIFAESVDGIDIDGSVFDRCGWSRQVDGTLKDSKFNQGNYIAGTCGPARVTNSVYTRCAGAGLQMRSGGHCENVFIGENSQAGFNIGWMRTDNVSSYPPGGAVPITVKNVVVVHRGGVAMRVGNVLPGVIDGLTILSDGYDWADALNLDALNNGNVHGITTLTISRLVARSTRYAILLSGTDWEDVKIQSAELDGALTDIAEWSNGGNIADFADPNNGLSRSGARHADLSKLVNPVIDDEFMADVLSGVVTAQHLCDMYKAH